jgi:DNA-binding Xre family transcriptional regulator
MKIARVAKSVTIGELSELCRKLGCGAKVIDGRVWLCR